MSTGNDIGDDWAFLADQRRQKRAQAMLDNTLIIKQSGLPYTSHNEGHHLIIKVYSYTINFWPSTEKWSVNGGKRSAGLKKLFEHIKQLTSAPDRLPCKEANDKLDTIEAERRRKLQGGNNE